MTTGNGQSDQHPVRHFWNAFRWSMKGIRSALKTEVAFRQEVCIAAILIPVAILLPVAALNRVLLITAVLLVLIVELLNSALEAIVDLVSPDYHELAGKAKDCGSAAVFISLISGALIWGLTIWKLILS